MIVIIAGMWSFRSSEFPYSELCNYMIKVCLSHYCCECDLSEAPNFECHGALFMAGQSFLGTGLSKVVRLLDGRTPCDTPIDGADIKAKFF